LGSNLANTFVASVFTKDNRDLVEYAASGCGDALNLLVDKLKNEDFPYNEINKKYYHYILLRLSQRLGSIQGSYNIGCFMDKHNINSDKAAIFLQKAVNNNYFLAKKKLDEVFPKTFKFKKMNKDYLRLPESFELYQKREIVLL